MVNTTEQIQTYFKNVFTKFDPAIETIQRDFFVEEKRKKHVIEILETERIRFIITKPEFLVDLNKRCELAIKQMKEQLEKERVVVEPPVKIWFEVDTTKWVPNGSVSAYLCIQNVDQYNYEKEREQQKLIREAEKEDREEKNNGR